VSEDITIESFTHDNSIITIAYSIGAMFNVVIYPIEAFKAFITQNEYLNYSHFKARHDNQWDEIEGMVSWDRYMLELVSDSDVKEFLKQELKKQS
jgi:hypothetical protein